MWFQVIRNKFITSRLTSYDVVHKVDYPPEISINRIENIKI